MLLFDRCCSLSGKRVKEEEIKEAVFELAGDEALGLDGFPMAFFQWCWGVFKEDVIAFMKELHSRGKPSKCMGASFIVLILKKFGNIVVKDFRPLILGRRFLQVEFRRSCRVPSPVSKVLL